MENDNEKFKNDFRKRLYSWVLELIQCIDSLPKDSVSEVMGRQILRSGTSILANYVEASATSSKKDFINFFTYSLKSANESKVWLNLLHDSGRDKDEKIGPLLKELTEIANVLASSILTMKGRK
ncbi:MAG: four helix bundle protein [Patescibacteria group bacterium]